MGGEGHNFVEASHIIMVTPPMLSFKPCLVLTIPVRLEQSTSIRHFDVRTGYKQDRKVRNAENITEWDKREKKAVMEAKGWTEDEFYKEASSRPSIDCTIACVQLHSAARV